jgi:hypothetical protein
MGKHPKYRGQIPQTRGFETTISLFTFSHAPPGGLAQVDECRCLLE